MQYLEIANSPVMFFLTATVIIVVVLQSIIFVRKAHKRGRELEMSDDSLKRAMTNSAILSIVPSLPIIVMMLALSVPLGKYFPWLRLSIVGSAVYEGMAANVAAQSQGLRDISDPGLTPEIFGIIMFVMTIGIIWGIVFNILFMKRIDRASKNARMRAAAGGKAGGFVTIFSAALFAGMLTVLSVPYVANAQNVPAIIAFVVAGLSVLICNKLAKTYSNKLLSDFSLPIALIAGMGAVILYSYFL